MDEERRCHEEEQHNNSYINYDLMVTQTLESKSRISQWLPDVWRPEGQDYPLQRLILGANTALQESSHLVIAKVDIPKHRPLYSVNRSNSCTIEIEKRINHPGEVIKACYMPQNPCIIATRASSSDVLVFDYTTQPSQPDPNGKCSPELILRGHKKKGYGLSWNPYGSGELISGSEDHTVCLWNMNHMPSEERIIDAITIFKDTSIVNDVEWYCHSANVFGSVADRKFIMWDTRCNQTCRIAHAHDAKVNCLAFNPIQEFSLATGSADKTIALWDIRYLKFKLLSLDFHEDEIFQVQWSPEYEKVLASRDAHGAIFFSDLSQIGTETSAEDDDDDENPELMFIHGGYSSNISDFSWNLNELFTLCSVEEDNILQVWQNN